MIPTALFVALLAVPAQQPANKDPDLGGFDFRGLHRDVAKLISEGKIDEAAVALDKVTASPAVFGDAGRENLRKKLAAVYAAAGKADGEEVVGYKRITSRVVKVFGVAYFDKLSVVCGYVYTRNAAGEWKLTGFSLNDTYAELELVTPLVPLAPRKD